jgi:hypothetical protein
VKLKTKYWQINVSQRIADFIARPLNGRSTSGAGVDNTLESSALNHAGDLKFSPFFPDEESVFSPQLKHFPAPFEAALARSGFFYAHI